MRIQTPEQEIIVLYKAPTEVLPKFSKEAGWTPSTDTIRVVWSKRPSYGHFRPHHRSRLNKDWRLSNLRSSVIDRFELNRTILSKGTKSA